MLPSSKPRNLVELSVTMLCYLELCFNLPLPLTYFPETALETAAGSKMATIAG